MFPRVTRRLPDRSSLPFHLVGSVVVIGAIAHFVTDDDVLATDGGETLVLLALSMGFFYGGHRMAEADLSRSDLRRVLAVTGGLGFLGFVASGFLIVVRLVEGEPLGEEPYVLFLTTTAAAAVGPPMGYYYVRLERSRDELRARYREVDVLNKRLTVANRVLRHNLRNDLNVIEGAASTLSREADLAEERKWLDVLDEQAEQLLAMCDQVAELQQVWRQDAREPIDLAAAIDRAVESVAEGFPDVAIEADSPDDAAVLAHPKLDSAIAEAIHNAARHNDTDDLRIDVTVETRAAGDVVRVRIEDDGAGIPEIEVEALSNPEETSLEHGSGVGLWLIYWVIEKSKGRLDVRGRDPSGTVVVMDLPPAGAADGADDVGGVRRPAPEPLLV